MPRSIDHLQPASLASGDPSNRHFANRGFENKLSDRVEQEGTSSKSPQQESCGSCLVDFDEASHLASHLL